MPRRDTAAYLNAVRQIGDPVLRMPAQPVSTFDAALKELEARMIEAMYVNDGVGLAAPQIGVSLSIFVMDCDGVEATVINPKLTIIDPTDVTESEGCLSVLGVRRDRTRAARAKVEGVDVRGRLVVVEAEGYAARCLQHEFDHLQGRLFIDPV